MNKQTNSPRNSPVAIIGLAGVFPGSTTVAEFFRNVLRKRCFVREVPDWLWDLDAFYSQDPQVPLKTYTKLASLVGDVDLDLGAFSIPPAVADHMSRNQKLALLCARDALADAGYLEREFDRERAGVILAAIGGELLTVTMESLFGCLFSARLEKLARNPDQKRVLAELWTAYQSAYRNPPITEDTLPGQLGSLVAGRIASVFDLHGPNFVLDSACASSLAAVAMAVTTLRTGVCDLVVTGGVDTEMSVGSGVTFCKSNALSAKGSYPFDARADGFVLGEGCGILILKRLDDALRDGDRIYALIRGFGCSSDGAGKGIMAPSSEGQLMALRRAYEDAGLGPADLQFVECHGTGTRVGDMAELTSVSRFLADVDPGSRRQSLLPIGSVKSMVGHLKIAAGAAGLFRGILAVNCRVVPPQVNFEEPNPGLDWDACRLRVPRRPEPITDAEVRVGVSGFGFGGTNYHVVLSSAPANAREPLVAVEDFLTLELPPPACDIAFTFPGQGSQYVGMLEPLRDDPVAQSLLERADEVVAEITGQTLSKVIYPDAARRERAEQLAAREAELRATAICQPAIFTVSAILLEKVRQLGIDCAMAIGHSLGESTALYAAGILSFEDALRAVATRGFLMGQLAVANPGGMAFVNAGKEEVSGLLNEIDGYAVCANVNSYEQTVVSGEVKAIAALIERATARGLQARYLEVAGAFHSRFMTPAVEPFRSLLERLSFRTTAIVVPANRRRQVYPYVADRRMAGLPMSEADRLRVLDLFAHQPHHPVDFVSQIELAYEAGIRRFAEVGPRTVLTGLVDDILQGKAFQVIHLDHRKRIGRRLSELRGMLATPVPLRRRPLPTKPRIVRPKTVAPVALTSTSLMTPVERVRSVVAEVSGYEVSKIADDAEFERDLGIDSLKILQIITRLSGTVLPEKFANCHATSVREILSFVSQAEPKTQAGALHQPQPHADRRLLCLRYEMASSELAAGRPLAPPSRYQVVLGPFQAAPKVAGTLRVPSADSGKRSAPNTISPAEMESEPTLILWPLPANAEELCRQTVPDLMRLVIDLGDKAIREQREPEVHVVTLSSPEVYSAACFRAISAMVKSFQWDLPCLRFSYCHLDTLDPEEVLLRRALADPVLERRVRADGEMEEARLTAQPELPNHESELAALLGPDDTVLVTGGARGIAASIVRHLLPRVRTRFLLVGRKTQREAWMAEEGQGRVDYLTADLCDPQAVLALGLANRGITLVIHAAGVNLPRPIRQITRAETDQVLGTKILGLQRILEGMDFSRLRGIVNFSSTAGFFGGAGFPHYGAANGYLSGFACGSVPVLSIGWSAWDEVGMASGDLPRQFLRMAGVELIPLQQGVRVFASLLADFLASGTPGAQSRVVHVGMAEGCFLPRDPLRAAMVPECLRETKLIDFPAGHPERREEWQLRSR